MPKIRDLGINVIPMTMRPPEIGRGGGYQLGADCANSCEGTFTCPEPSLPNCVPSCAPSSHPRRAGGLTPDAIAQLKQQLQNQLHQ